MRFLVKIWTTFDINQFIKNLNQFINWIGQKVGKHNHFYHPSARISSKDFIWVFSDIFDQNGDWLLLRFVLYCVQYCTLCNVWSHSSEEEEGEGEEGEGRQVRDCQDLSLHQTFRWVHHFDSQTYLHSQMIFQLSWTLYTLRKKSGTNLPWFIYRIHFYKTPFLGKLFIIFWKKSQSMKRFSLRLSISSIDELLQEEPSRSMRDKLY